MSRITRTTTHLALAEVKRRVKLDPRLWCRQRWLIIYNALAEPKRGCIVSLIGSSWSSGVMRTM
jgi:hypothetical protein